MTHTHTSVKRLIAFVVKGSALLSYKDVLDNFREELYIEKRHGLEILEE